MSATRPDPSAWLVAAKLRPPLYRSDTVKRSHLEDALCRSVTTLPLTLVSAPAGYGKTTMLAALQHLLPGYGLAWVTLDSEDEDPVRFIGLLATALQRLNPGCGQAVWTWLSSGTSGAVGLKQAMGALVDDVMQYLPDPFLLVLDDLHLVTEPAVYVALEFLIEHQPPQMHLAIGTRNDPPLRLARLAARRQLAEFRLPDLKFSRDETHQLLNSTLGLSLTDGEVEALQERTEGWPAGLCLLAGPLGRVDNPGDRAQLLSALSHAERYALDFLADEALRNLQTDDRLFLLRSSVLAEMTPAACSAVTGREDAGEVLERLYRQNLTIASLSTDAEGEPVYRHHALFARLLARQLARELPDEVADLHRRAALVQKTAGRAIHHFLSAKLWSEAVNLMVESGPGLLHSGLAETFRTWYGSIPPEIRTNEPRLTVLMGRCEILRGDYAEAGVLLERAREAFVAAGDAEGEGQALTSLLTLAYRNDDRTKAAALVRRGPDLPLSPMGQVALRLVRAWLRMTQPGCDWNACHDDIREAFAVGDVTGDRTADMTGIPYMSAPLAAVPGCLALAERFFESTRERSLPGTAWRVGADELSVWPLIWRGQTGEALARVEAAEALRQAIGGYPFIGNDLSAQLAILCLDQGNADAAAKAAETLLQRLPGSGPSKWPFYLHAAGRTLALVGRSHEARAIWQRLADLCNGDPLADCLRDHLAGLLALLNDDWDGAASALERAVALEIGWPVAWVGGSARLLQARLLLEQGRTDDARAAAADVLKAWEQAGTPGCVLLDGPAVTPVVQLLDRPARARAQGITKTGARPDLTESLTPRECEVLQRIVAGRTNREIAEELYISEETVKTHVVRILRKLEVTSRTQAAILGREMGF